MSATKMAYPPCPEWCGSEPHDWDSTDADGNNLYRGHDCGAWEMRVNGGRNYVSITVGATEKQGEPVPAPTLNLDVSSAGALLTVDEARDVMVGLAEMINLAKEAASGRRLQSRRRWFTS